MKKLILLLLITAGCDSLKQPEDEKTMRKFCENLDNRNPWNRSAGDSACAALFLKDIRDDLRAKK